MSPAAFRCAVAGAVLGGMVTVLLIIPLMPDQHALVTVVGTVLAALGMLVGAALAHVWEIGRWEKRHPVQPHEDTLRIHRQSRRGWTS